MLKSILGDWCWEKTTWPCILYISTFISFSIVQPVKFNIDEGADYGASQKFLAEQKVYMKYKPWKLIDLKSIIREKFKCMLLNRNNIFRSAIAVLDATSNFNIEFSANSVKKQTTNKIFPKSISCHQLKFPIESTDSDSLEDECVEHHIVADKQVSI